MAGEPAADEVTTQPVYEKPVNDTPDPELVAARLRAAIRQPVDKAMVIGHIAVNSEGIISETTSG